MIDVVVENGSQVFWLGQATVVAFASVEFLSYEQSSANDVEGNVFGLRRRSHSCFRASFSKVRLPERVRELFNPRPVRRQ